MLAKANRLRTAADFRCVHRQGKRLSMETMTVSIVRTSESAPARFGFVVTKKVGNAVSRNLVRRRLKAIARELVDSGLRGVDVVGRALPSAVHSDWTTLRHELSTALKGL